MSKKEEELQELEHLEAVDDVIGKPPSWIIRRGTIIVIGIIIMVFAGASFIEYPDVISGKVFIESVPMGKHLVASRLKFETATKVQIGQKAIIKLRKYKYDSYGALMATVSEITNDTDSMVVNMRLDKGFITSTGKTIPSQFKLTGDVQIIGEKQTVLHRLFFRE